MSKRNIMLLAIAGAIALLLPLVVHDQYILHIAVVTFIYIGITVAWNLMAIGGTLSLGHAAFFGVGAYTVAILYVDYGVNPWIGIAAGMVMAGLVSLLLAIPLLRLRGPFFTLSSLAFVEILRLLAIWATELTNGSVGITTPPDQGFAFISFERREPYYFIILAFVILTVAFSVWLYNSRTGYHLRAMKIDEEAVRALGVRSSGLKVGTMIISAAITGAFGAFAALYFFVIEPETQFSMTLYSVQPALNGIIGGMGTVVGPIIGAIIMTPLGEWLRTSFAGVQGLNFMIYGLALILIVRLMPGGLVDGFQKVVRRFRKKGGAAKAPESEAVPAKKGGEQE
ncbi:branched-chain amino acid ABC transporter permease [Gulosibacter sp. 10]|uniref:branched-chain amino acid ABC transporter permease n=1 Tax=Gulosibacter sp. 10 TaxID=1255570 RepID=UPI00097EEC21|nr:branched-chain amino acid ABC transporter permease [Gulosibacter sp. 10]SJM71108.1 Branched-chain amino acid transport ATP-binding protein LivG (TC 3.A.1.4.1) [Gulosibacter sp. 10]